MSSFLQDGLQAECTAPLVLPKISIVVPNYNGGDTLGATLESLINQAYPHLEIIVMDGGSTDHSIEVIKQYEKHLTYWQSENDSGQSDAINQGFARATGEIINWLCSDDLLPEGALQRVGEEFKQDPALDVLSGWARNVHLDLEGREIGERFVSPTAKSLKLLPAGCPVAQPSTFYRRRTLDREGPINESYHFLMDMELWAYFVQKKYVWRMIDQVLSVQVISGLNKSQVGGERIIIEAERLYRTYSQDWIPMCWWHRHLIYPLEKWRGKKPQGFRHNVVRAYKALLFVPLAPFYGLNRLRAMNWSLHSLPPTNERLQKGAVL
ncbi:glycosyltransferase family 2 protein [Pontiellaceae bacterium B12227]|nr:glycosyltransferase family 2 protein [Pontiellaceae bacterium B12227]